MPFKQYPEISFVTGADRIITTSILSYYDLRSKQLFVIAPGFECDGASIPKALWSLLGHPYTNGVRNAAVLHDWLYRNNIIGRRKCDQMFKDALVEEGLPESEAQAFYMGVRLGGGDTYSKYTNILKRRD